MVETEEAEESQAVAAYKDSLRTDTPNTDDQTYLNQIWMCLVDMHKIVQSNSSDLRPLIDMFIAFAVTNFSTLVDVEELAVDSAQTTATKDPGSYQNLLNYLKFFSVFKSPQQFHRSAELFKIFSKSALSNTTQFTFPNMYFCFSLLMHGSETVQTRALDCIMQWKLEYLVPYKDHLTKLISEKTIRDELAGWSMRLETTDILPHHRPLLLPVITDILYPKLVIKGRAQAQHVRATNSPPAFRPRVGQGPTLP